MLRYGLLVLIALGGFAWAYNDVQAPLRDLKRAAAGYVASLVFLYGFYGMFAELARADGLPGSLGPFGSGSARRSPVLLVLTLAFFVLMLPCLVPFIQRRPTSQGFAAWCVAVMALPLLAALAWPLEYELGLFVAQF